MQALQTAGQWVWQTTLAASLLIALAAPILFLCRKPSFLQLRYLIGLLILARFLFSAPIASPFSLFNVAPRGLPLPPLAAVPMPNPPLQNIAITGPTPGAPRGTMHFASSQVLPLLWLAGAIVLSLRVLVQYLQVRRWIRASEQITSGPACDALRLALERIPVPRTISLRVVPQIQTPALAGFARPKILLPPNLAREMDVESLRLIFLHELAHIRRRDILVNWGMILARAIHWFNPLAWIVFRRLAADQELLCDATVLRALNAEQHHRYGETLLALATRRAAPATILPASGKFTQMKERIAMISQFKPSTARRIGFSIVVAAALGVVTFTRAVDETEERNRRPKPAREIEIRRNPRGEPRIDALRREFEILSRRINEREHELDELREKLGVAGPLVDEDSLPAPETVVNIDRELSRLEQEQLLQENLVARVKGMSPKERRGALPAVHSDAGLTQLINSLGDIQQTHAEISRTLGAEHPEVLRANAAMSNINQRIDARVEDILTGLETMVGSRARVIEQLRESSARLKARDAELRRHARPYFNLRRDVEVMRRVRDSLHARLLEAEIDQCLLTERPRK